MLTGSEFSPAEEGLRRAVAAGALADLREGNQRADDPHGGQIWGPGRTIRAEVLVHLLTEVVAAERPRSVRLAARRAHQRAPHLLRGDSGQPRETCAQRQADHGGPEHDLQCAVHGLR